MKDGGSEHDIEATRPTRPREWPEFPGYRVLGILGRGGMGTIFRAVQLGMERPVAIKVLRLDLAQQGLSVERLKREARVAGRLDHPQIVKGIEVGEHAGRHYFVMEYVDGRSLKALLKSRGALEEDEVLDVGIQIARALAHAHANGIIHRDVKPGNILIGPGGSIKLTDLGLARGPEDPTLTVDGATVGTPQYMAPEQARDPGQVDRRSDIYSLGATLFHALTGSPPFEAETIGQLLTKVLHDPAPDPARVRPEVSEGLALVIRKALQKDPFRRYPSASALLADLQRVRDHLPPRVKASSLDELDARLGLRIAVAALLVVLLVIAGFVFFAPSEERKDGGSAVAVAEELVARDVASAREAAERALSEEAGVLLGPYQRVLDSIAQIEAAGSAQHAELRAQLEQTRKRVVAVLETQLENLARQQESRVELPRESEGRAAWRAAVRLAFGVELARLPAGIGDAARAREDRVLGTWERRRAEAIANRRAEIVADFDRFVKRDLDLRAEVREGAFTAALSRLEMRHEEARGELRHLLDETEGREACQVLEKIAEPFRVEVEQVATARVNHVVEALNAIDSRLVAGTFDLDVLGDRSPRAWLDEIFEEHSLSADGDLPVSMRLTSDPFPRRDALTVKIEQAAKLRREERAERAWAIARASLDVWLPERRYAYARSYLAKQADGDIAGGPASASELEDCRDQLVEPLADLLSAAEQTLAAAEAAQRKMRLQTRDGREVQGVPQRTAEGVAGLEARGVALGREPAIALDRIAVSTLLEWAGKRDDPLLSALVRFADGLAAPLDPEVDRVLAEIQGLDRTRWLALLDWLDASRIAWRSRSEQAQAEIASALRDVEAIAAAGDLERALSRLREIAARHAGAPELLTSGFDERERELERRVAAAQIEARVRAKIGSARVAVERDAVLGVDLTRVTYDLREREIAADLGLERIDGFYWSASHGLRRARPATEVHDAESLAALVFDWGEMDFDLSFPVRIELELRCPRDSGRPFFGSVTQGEWTLGLLGQAALPVRGLEPDLDLLAHEAGVGWPRGRTFLARGRSLAAVTALLSRPPESPVLWSAPWNGFLRGTTQRLTLVWSEQASRLQVYLEDGSSSVAKPILEARPTLVRRRHLRELGFRSWETLELRQVALIGKVQ